eukprot:3949917-Heterocapsa_arctica.AAC.1
MAGPREIPNMRFWAPGGAAAREVADSLPPTRASDSEESLGAPGMDGSAVPDPVADDGRGGAASLAAASRRSEIRCSTCSG